MGFVPGLVPASERAAGWWFFFHGSSLLVREDAPAGEAIVPCLIDPTDLALAPDAVEYLGTLDGKPCFAAGFDAVPSPVPDGCRFRNLRELFGVLPEALFAVATRAAHLAQWELAHRFCGRCAHPLALKSDERAKACSRCGQIYFPQISPAVIVAVRRGDRLLMARSPRFPPGMFSVLAGFVETGETLEACVQREIREEVSIEVRNIRYFGSQPWPYPNSLMLGFKADYASGGIRVDGVEILEADWFAPDYLPTLPGKLSIARALIDDFVRSAAG